MHVPRPFDAQGPRVRWINDSRVTAALLVRPFAETSVISPDDSSSAEARNRQVPPLSNSLR